MPRSTATRALVVAGLLLAAATPGWAKPKTTKSPTPEPTPDPLAEVDKAAGHKVEPGAKIQFVTTQGTFVAVLFPKEAPKHAANFEKLVKSKFYDGLKFHRVIPGFVAQGGDPKGDGTGGPGWTVPAEFSKSLKHLRGTLAMARSQDPNSAGSQFYVCYQPISHLDGQYTVFGQVISGMDVVDKLTPTEGPNAGKPDKMLKVTVLK